MKIIHRVVEFIKYKECSMRSFEGTLYLSNGYISKQYKAGASIGSDIIERMIRTYPEINPIWLITGEGDMILDPKNMSEPDFRYNTSFDLLLENRISKIVESQLRSVHEKIDNQPTLEDIRNEIITILFKQKKN